MLSVEEAISAARLVAEAKLKLFYDQSQITVKIEDYEITFHADKQKLLKVQVKESNGVVGFKKL